MFRLFTLRKVGLKFRCKVISARKTCFLHRFVLSPLSEGTKSNAVVVQKRNCSTHKVKKIYEKKLLKYFKFGSSTKCYLFTVCFRKPFFEKRFKI